MVDRLGFQLGNIIREQHLWLAVAESCTGGMLSHRITNIPGASEYFRGGVIAYANEVKVDILGVSSKTLDDFGAVSEETVIEMARGVRKSLDVDIGVSVSGIAGPSGGTIEKPVGTTWIGFSSADRDSAVKYIFPGNRYEINSQASDAAMKMAINYLLERVSA